MSTPDSLVASTKALKRAGLFATLPFGGPLANQSPRWVLTDRHALRAAFGWPGNGGDYDRFTVLGKWLTNGRTCHYCAKPLDEELLTADHLVPLSRGGSHREANTVPCCPRCNQRKGSRTLREWQHGGLAKRYACGPALLEMAENSPLAMHPRRLVKAA